jgi:protein-L-isoaspartate(D-aspartate) O-methyltransferase
VPRQPFVTDSDRAQAYEDHPLPIGLGQTISQPYIVAIMIEALAIDPSNRILEVGTGSGYVTAVLSEMASHVYSIERHGDLLERARDILAELGCQNVTFVLGDGSRGLAEFAPFDAILVSAATPVIPPALFAQLREGGRMVLPVGAVSAQELQLVVKHNGSPLIRTLDGCRFVPLVVDDLTSKID